MPQSLNKAYVHIVFATKCRAATITPQIRQALFHVIGTLCKDCDCIPLRVGGYVDHVHILMKLNVKKSLAECMARIKSRSCHWVRQHGNQHKAFEWQDGYAVFSVSYESLERVANYIDRQEEHHSKK